MTQEIKQRIEQIKRGEVPLGYKKTKVGIVPSEWELDTLSRCIIEIKKLSNELDKYQVFSSSRIGLLPKSEYFDNREVEETNLGYKIVPPAYVTYRHMSDDDIFRFNINETGKTILVSAEYPVFNSSKKSCLGFIIPTLNNTSRFRYFCKCQKLGGTRTRLYLKTLSTYQLALPPILVQQKISDILTTCDKVIELKEKLLVQKQAQKKYLMQNLLTGKKRLKGFTKNWKKANLGDISIMNSGGTPKSNIDEYYDGNIIWVSIKDMSDGKKYLFDSERKISIVGLENSSARIFNINTVLYAMYASIGECCIAKCECSTSQAILGIVCSDLLYHEFLYYFLTNLKEKIKLQGQIGTQANLNKQMVCDIKIPLPPLTEQTAIAEILSIADREIDLMKKDVDAEKQKKKALMQLLLTGIVRV